jgi:hypothetical protein
MRSFSYSFEDNKLSLKMTIAFNLIENFSSSNFMIQSTNEGEMGRGMDKSELFINLSDKKSAFASS